MQTRHQIAMLAAGLLVGAQIGVAAIGTIIPETEQHMEPAPGDTQVLESDAAGEQADAGSEPATAHDGNAPAAIAEAEQPILPVAPRYIEARGVFPASADDLTMLPSLVAYLERTEHLRLAGANGHAYPPSADDLPMLPAMVSFLERRETARLAALNPAPAASEVAAASPANASGASQATAAPAAALAAEREVAALGTRSTLTPF